jgi:hypothetical protein
MTGSGQWLWSWETSRGDKLHLHYILSLRAFWTLRDLEFDLLALFEGLEAVALNGAIVNEDVRGAWLLNKTIALRVIEPLDLAGYSRHNKRILLTIR